MEPFVDEEDPLSQFITQYYTVLSSLERSVHVVAIPNDIPLNSIIQIVHKTPLQGGCTYTQVSLKPTKRRAHDFVE